MLPVMRKNQITIIDLFAGPGGLCEGFTSVVDKNNERYFRIALSIEKDEYAHNTLTLRSFLRQFPFNKFPSEYYQFVQGKISVEELYSLYPNEASCAKNEAWKFTLGEPQTHDIIDKRIRKVLKGEKNFVLIGGPPCQAYSLVGRARRQQINLDKEDERVYLYREYYRILAEHRPVVFIMENVKGILSSKVENDNLFYQIINDLKDPIRAYKKLQGQEKIYKSTINYKIYSLVKEPSYKDLFNLEPFFKPQDFIIKTEEYGIPQTRHRVILLGIRSDSDIKPQLLQSAKNKIPVENVLNGLPQLRSGLSKIKDSASEWRNCLLEIKTSSFKSEIEKDVWSEITNIVNDLRLPESDRGSSFVNGKINSDYLPDWFLDNKIKGAINHETRSHIKEDLYRYLFAACFAKIKNRSPKLFDFPNDILPNHFNARGTKFIDRFRVQLYGEPSKTITSHISKDGHYFIHPDPAQSRSLTVREAARIQTFPDNYFFCGPRTAQFHQVGNAVPPYLAKQIGKVVKDILF